MVVTVLPMYRRSGELAGIAVVDYEDFRWASAIKWSLGAQGYAVRKVGGRKGELRLLHREVLGLVKGDGLFGDHIDGNRLDCRRSNLRPITREHSAQNVGGMAGSSSRFRGVSWDASRSRWKAQINSNGRNRYLGRFVCEEEAARVAAEAREREMPFSVEGR